MVNGLVWHTYGSNRNRPMRDWNNYVRHLIGERFYCEWFGLADVRQQEEQAIEGLEQQCTTFNC